MLHDPKDMAAKIPAGNSGHLGENRKRHLSATS